MGDLQAGCRPLGMDGIGQHLQMTHHFACHMELVMEGPPLGRHCAIGDRGHTDAPCCNVPVMLDQGLGGHPVGCHPLIGPRFNEAVA
ncbi:hypothetical protein D3C80_1453970 [compost metagenome]